MLRNFQNRIALFFAVLFIVIQALTIFSVYRVSRDNLVQQLRQNLLYAEQVFQRLMMERSERMAIEARILVADFGFRSTVSTGDGKTIASALENLALRIRAQRAFYIDLSGRIVSDTANRMQNSGFVFPDALTMAEHNSKAVILGMLDGKLYEWAIVPVLAPLPIGWVAIAQEFDQRRIQYFKQLSPFPLEISIVQLAEARSTMLASSLPAKVQGQLTAALASNTDFAAQNVLDDARLGYISRIHRLPVATLEQSIAAVLQIDYARAQAQYWPLFYATAALLVLGLLLALAGSVLIARNLSRPLRVLAGASKGMMQGIKAKPLETDRNDEFGQLAETFNRAALLAAEIGDLRKKDQLRREMVATVSHDLRTPLTSLYGFLETMQFKADSLPAKEQQQFLQTALRQTEKVSRLAQELFELARLECDETSLTPEQFCLAELLQDVVQKFQLQAQARGVDLAAELRRDLPLVNADIGLIERLLTNLIDNALRHTPNGGKVTIGAEPIDDRIFVSVHDSGTGIPANYLPTLFEWDSPLSRQARNQGGGFGLVVVDKIVRLHGGSIKVDSTVGCGSEFRFDLPQAHREN